MTPQEANKLKAFISTLVDATPTISTTFPIWKTIKIDKKIIKKDLEAKGDKVSDWESELLKKVSFRKETLQLVRLKVSKLGLSDEYPTTQQIYERIKELGLELCPASVAPTLRLEYVNQPMSNWLYVGMEPVSDPGVRPDVFYLSRDADGVWLRSSWGKPEYKWAPGAGFVFRLPSPRLRK